MENRSLLNGQAWELAQFSKSLLGFNLSLVVDCLVKPRLCPVRHVFKVSHGLGCCVAHALVNTPRTVGSRLGSTLLMQQAYTFLNHVLVDVLAFHQFVFDVQQLVRYAPDGVLAHVGEDEGPELPRRRVHPRLQGLVAQSPGIFLKLEHLVGSLVRQRLQLGCLKTLCEPLPLEPPLVTSTRLWRQFQGRPWRLPPLPLKEFRFAMHLRY